MTNDIYIHTQTIRQNKAFNLFATCRASNTISLKTYLHNFLNFSRYIPPDTSLMGSIKIKYKCVLDEG